MRTPSHRSASCNAGASPTIQRSRRDRDNEAVLSRAVHPEWGLVVQSGARSLRHRDAIISLPARYKLPAVYSARDYASAGGLKSEKPADLPVQLSVKYETVLNMTTAKALGLDVPTSILLSADELIE